MMQQQDSSSSLPTTTTTTEPVSIDSDRESTKSDSDCECAPSTSTKQDMFIWNPHFEASQETSVVNLQISQCHIALQKLGANHAYSGESSRSLSKLTQISLFQWFPYSGTKLIHFHVYLYTEVARVFCWVQPILPANCRIWRPENGGEYCNRSNWHSAIQSRAAAETLMASWSFTCLSHFCRWMRIS